MNEFIQNILQDKTKMMIAAGILAVVIALFVTVGIVVSTSGGNGQKADPKSNKIIKEKLVLLTTDNLGKAIEIQSLLARQNIEVKRNVDGTKSELYLEKYTMSQRDAALLAIVKSGLMDQNVGLEVFDKGDFTSTKEDKKIRLARAMNGELARLIKKLDKVENATVFISIPETKMFTSMQQAPTAAVQVTLTDGGKLDRTDVKAITNLLMGAVQNLEQENVTITDTEGNVYASLAAADDQLTKLEESDNYMKSKVKVQLDKLIGKGNYAVSVSTFLTQAPIERSRIGYDPATKTAVSEQSFAEGLGDQTRDSNQGLTAVSSYLPDGLPNGSASSAQNRSYSRTAREVQYGVSKVQESEYIKKGVIEDISIAVTLDERHMPANVTLEELKELVAHSASPKVNPNNVTIAFFDSQSPELEKENPAKKGVLAEKGNPFWLEIVASILILLAGYKYMSGKLKQEQEKNSETIEALKGKTTEQEKQLQDMNLKAAELIEKQSEMAQAMLEQQQHPQIEQQPAPSIPQPVPQDIQQINETISEVSSDMEDVDEDEMLDQVMSWIEKP